MFDQLTRAAWPALEEVHVDGWVARFAAGVTQRANSVVPFAAPTDLEAAVSRMEQLYAERGLPAVFQIGRDDHQTELDRVLADRGYRSGSPTSIQATEIGDVQRPDTVDIAEAPDQDWLDLWWAVDGRGDEQALAVAVKILTGGPGLYATARDSHGPTAVGRLALVGEWGGVYCLAVRPDVRRQGLGGAVLTGLLAAGKEHGITRSWLQVLAHNETAQRLYQRFGYTETAGYHYRVQRR